MAIPPPFNAMEVNMVAFEGDFESLSVIISGFPSENALAGAKVDGTGAAVAADDDDEEEDEDLLDTDEDEAVDKADNYLYKVQSASFASESAGVAKLNAKLRAAKLHWESKGEAAAKIEGILPSTWFADSHVSIKSVAALVGEIFSFAESLESSGGSGHEGGAASASREEVESKVLLLNRLSEYLQACWRTGDELPVSPDQVLFIR